MHLRDALAATHATNELMEGRKVPTECQRELTEFSCFLSADFRLLLMAKRKMLAEIFEPLQTKYKQSRK